MPAHLVDRRPEVAVEALIGQLVPPPLFAGVRFDSYRPDPDEPSQAAALATVRDFAVSTGESGRRSGLFRRAARRPARSGVYLDGGFGVGKTHLLASLWHAVPGPKAYATFVELTQLAGALGFARLVDELSGMRLLAIDEFELDDPGDTVLVSTLLARLDEAGVRFAATSNTLPDRLGEERFATADFLREIQAMAARFEAVRVDGPDYRHRGLPEPPAPLTDGQVVRVAGRPDASLDDFGSLLAHLGSLHPSRYGALLDGVGEVCLTGLVPAPDQNVALRLVVLADRLYDRQLPVTASGVPIDQLFTPEMLAGGYRKKYRRAISRLVALARLSSAFAL
ncbi:MAG TPA: cell division protein ZapE [Jatrophihabitans sp.]|nr:cell division protein ZapE [Jatrophihabitans sp.]